MNSITASTRLTRYGMKLDLEQRIIINGKRKEKDGQRWMAKETAAAFSSIKRMFGEYTSMLSGFKFVKR